MKRFQDSKWYDYFNSFLSMQKKSGLYRSLKTIYSSQDVYVTLYGKRYLHFSSNNYLGLANHPRLKRLSSLVVKNWGTGSCASPLITGYNALYEALEKRLCSFKENDSAIIFPCGYSANVGVISSLVNQDDLILSDELNHASIIDGCRLSKAKLIVYPHKDIFFVEKVLKNRPVKGKVLVVTDAVFSMDGDIAPLRDLVRLCEEYEALLYVDDAHGTGVLGDKGKGTLKALGVYSKDVVQIGTFSKALGSIGGFVVARRVVVDYLINRCRSFIYSTALPPGVLAANKVAIDVVEKENKLRDKLKELGSYLKPKLSKLGLKVTGDVNHIMGLIIGNVKDTLALCDFLMKNGIYIPAIRPPSVPINTSRLRISLCALHTKEHLDFLVDTLTSFFRKGA